MTSNEPQAVSFADFSKLDMRIGTICVAERIEGADKLLRLEVDIGETEPRQAVAGIAPYVPDPSVLAGKQCTLLVNLERKVIRGHESQGMLLAAAAHDAEGNEVFTLITPEREVPAGTRVR